MQDTQKRCDFCVFNVSEEVKIGARMQSTNVSDYIMCGSKINSQCNVCVFNHSTNLDSKITIN